MDIATYRKKRGISQLKLSYMAKVSRFRLNLHESGHLTLRDEEILKISKAITEVDKEKPNANK